MDNGYEKIDQNGMNSTPSEPGVKPTVRNAVRMMSAVCIIIFFCPTFMVSCSGQDIGVSAAGVVGGLKYHGSTIGGAHPVMLLALLLPAALIGITFADSKLNDKGKAIATICITAASIFIWNTFRSAVKSAADENYCEYRSTLWYALNLIILVLLMIISILILADKIKWETNLIVFIKGGEMRDLAQGMAASVKSAISEQVQKQSPGPDGSIPPETPGGADTGIHVGESSSDTDDEVSFCPHCGKPIKAGSRFCTKCGSSLN